MNTAQLKAFFAKNKTAVLGTAAAGVAGLALLHRKQAAAGGGAGGGGGPAGTIPAAAVVPGGGSYDSSAYDVYSALQSQLGPILEQARKGGVTTAPAPVASELFTPGFFQNVGTGRIYQIDTQGNADWLGPAEFKALGGTAKNVTKIATDSTFWQKITRIDPKDKADNGRMPVK